MTVKYDHLLNRPFEFGKVDCYTIVREFYGHNYGILLPNYARPTDFWQHGMDMYFDRYYQNGFRPLDVHPSEYQTGDVILMAIRSQVANHAGVLVENGNMIHHLYGQLSCVVPYRGVWRNTTTAVLRHKDVNLGAEVSTVSVVDTLSPHMQRKVHAALSDPPEQV